MARRTRIHFKKAIYHVQLRAKKGQTLFRSVADRRAWESLVEDGCERFGHRIHAFSWLNNKVNLVIQVDEIPLSQIMQNLSFRYTRYVNRDLDRSGPIFEGRYRAVVVDPELYLTELVRYVHNEPVRDGKAPRGADPWIGVGKGQRPELGAVLSPGGATNTIHPATPPRRFSLASLAPGR